MSDSVLPRLQSIVASLCVLALSCVTEASATRYVYRIGGEGLPETEFPAGWDVQFVPLAWDDVNENLFGASSLTELTGGSLRPVGLDPEVNLTPQIRESGGFIKSPDGYSFKDEAMLDLLFDGDDNTAYSGGGSHFTGHGSCFGIPPETETVGGYNARKCATADRIFLRFGPSKGIHFNLGGRLPIRRIEFYPTPRYESERFVKHFMVGTNDGNDLLEGTREAAFWVGRYGLFVDFDVRHLIFENNTSRVVLDMEDVPIENIVFESSVGAWEIAEFKIFGAGFAPTASYTSNIIDLGESAALGNLSWSGTRPEGTDVVMRMRSGNLPDPHFYWRKTFRGDERTRFDDNGKALSRAVYDKLEGGERQGSHQIPRAGNSGLHRSATMTAAPPSPPGSHGVTCSSRLSSPPTDPSTPIAVWIFSNSRSPSRHW